MRVSDTKRHSSCRVHQEQICTVALGHRCKGKVWEEAEREHANGFGLHLGGEKESRLEEAFWGKGSLFTKVKPHWGSHVRAAEVYTVDSGVSG